ncbi:DUF2756 domain-containing protein [Shimwellia blattae]|uniref:DUF2756 domain-containing protein n=1 Tax=Shimwellia blattae (strain ATCC 29907 / DSM 4481 / JCM 1650 / NBRC 105725 / CDC 9005-74) TaxID=630626 RepID=I2B478_SHIBC|nr:DUF2756 domain-containing protein [Shimwellia blattae]AFJ45332.1 hypothetical protein EBL_c01970 [Shimwellia blattae DSM 4481 = NBRC 105725]GAB80556.1 hypothetical protein YhhA [Shimwellia blattae DSM 4481 = NBRC 105725]VDY62813.1 Protein of uncharacterised function (DUF2756) [Shimwellia blattae]VEC19681.1 Protein of uncharacterised function (DUF2756) [Shimwellia blattae]
MKRLFWLALMVPLSTLANPFSQTTNPNQPNYQNPSQQRLAEDMRTQQSLQKSQLQQSQQMQRQQQSQQLQRQIEQNRQRTQSLQPGNPPRY